MSVGPAGPKPPKVELCPAFKRMLEELHKGKQRTPQELREEFRDIRRQLQELLKSRPYQRLNAFSKV